LHTAAAIGKKEVVELLLDYTGCIDYKSGNGDTALHLAVSYGHTEVVKLLLDSEADVNIIHSEGGTALHLAARSGVQEVVELLLDRKANIDAASIAGDTALHTAVTSGRTEVVVLLLKRGADPTIRNKEGKTAVEYQPELFSDARICNIFKDCIKQGDEKGITNLAKSFPQFKEAEYGLFSALQDQLHNKECTEQERSKSFDMAVHMIEQGFKANVVASNRGIDNKHDQVNIIATALGLNMKENKQLRTKHLIKNGIENWETRVLKPKASRLNGADEQISR
jgi:ankyrin repeat protein